MTSRPVLEQDNDLRSAIESILLVAGGPVAVTALASTLQSSNENVTRAIMTMQKTLQSGIRVQVHDNHVQLVTAPENSPYVQRFLGTVRPPSLSRPALEVLSIVAYRQPITRSEIEHVRGVNSDRTVHTLLARGLIEERGQRDTLGRPMQYGTGFGFLEYFGLSSLHDLPSLEQLRNSGSTVLDLGMRASEHMQVSE